MPERRLAVESRRARLWPVALRSGIREEKKETGQKEIVKNGSQILSASCPPTFLNPVQPSGLAMGTLKLIRERANSKDDE